MKHKKGSENNDGTHLDFNVWVRDMVMDNETSEQKKQATENEIFFTRIDYITRKDRMSNIAIRDRPQVGLLKETIKRIHFQWLITKEEIRMPTIERIEKGKQPINTNNIEGSNLGM